MIEATSAELEQQEAPPDSALLSAFDSLLVAFSGGVDSAYLALRGLARPPGRVLCVTADSPSYPRRHREMAEAVAREFRLAHEFIETRRAGAAGIPGEPGESLLSLQDRAVRAPLPRSRATAASRAIVDGNNADDRGDYRPGRQAAREFGVRSPLDEADLTKDEIRELSRAARPADVGRAGLGLPVVAHSVPQRSDAGEAVDDRAAEERLCIATDSACAACGTTTRSPASKSDATRWPRALDPGRTRRHRARPQGDWLPARQPRPPGLPDRQPERSPEAPSRLIASSFVGSDCVDNAWVGFNIVATTSRSCIR